MFSSRWRKVLRGLWKHKVRTFLVVMSIAVGVFAVGVIMTTSTVLSRELSGSYAEIHPASIELYASDLDDDIVDAVARMPNVEQAEGRAVHGPRIKIGESEWKNFTLMAVGDYEQLEINRVTPELGTWPPPKREILLERQSLEALGRQVGDSILVETYDGRRRWLRIAGTVHDLSVPPAKLFDTVYGYVTADSLEWLGFSSNYTVLNVVVADGLETEEEISDVAEEIKLRLQKGGKQVWGYWVPPPGKHPSDESVQPLLMMLSFIGVLTLGLSGFLVVNTIAAIMTQEVRQIGIMKAVGARNRQIVGLYLGMVLGFGLLSLVVAVPVGGVVAAAFSNYLAEWINFDVDSHAIPTSVLAVEVSVGLIVPTIAALVPVIQGSRVTAREAMSEYGLGNSKKRRGPIDRLINGVRGLPRPLALSLRNTFRRKARLVLTLITLTLAGAIFIGVICVHASLLATLDEAFDYWNHEITVNFRRAHRLEKIEREASRIPRVLNAECWDFASANPIREDGGQGERMLVVATPAKTDMVKPILMEGRWLLEDGDNAIVVNSMVLKEEPEITVGDDLTLRLDKGADNVEITWRVVGIVRGVFTGPIAYANSPYFARAMGRVGRASQVRIQLAADAVADQKQAAKELEAHFNRVGLRVSRYELSADSRAGAERQVNILTILLLAMAVLLAFVGALGLMGTMSINVLERTREIGVMRAVGASSAAVQRIVIVEGIIIGTLSWALGTVLAVPLSHTLNAMLGTLVVQDRLTYRFAWNGLGIWLTLVLVLATLASFLPARYASRLTVHDILAYE